MRLHTILLVALLGWSSCASCTDPTPAIPAPIPEPEPEPGDIMPAFTFTASASTDQLTITGHGLVTGDGPAAVRTIGGTLPGGLAPVTDYFIIRVDANALKLATSSSNAMAGTAINLTSDGSGGGTNMLEIGLPYRVPRIAAAGTQIKSADLNATWQSLVAIYDLLTGQAQSIWTGVTIAGDLHLGGVFHHGSVTRPVGLSAPGNSGLSAFAIQINAGGTWTAQLSVPVGERITALRARVIDSIGSSTTIRGRLFSSTDGTASAALATTNTSSASGSEQTLSATGLSVDVVSNVTYHVTFDIPSGSGSCKVHAAETDSFVP